MKKNKKLILLLCLTLLGNGMAGGTNFSYALEENDDETVVEVPDYNLRRGFLEALNYIKGDHRVLTEYEINTKVFKKKDLKKITKLSPEVCQAHNSSEEGVKIADLTGIEACVNLEDLSLVNQKITDLSPLKNLTKLKRLELRNSSLTKKDGTVLTIEDVSPLKNLTSLEILNLQQAKIKNVENLSNLVNMKHLNLMSTKIENLEFARKMTNLEYLDVSYNSISDVNPLKDCVNLKFLNFSNNPNFLFAKAHVKDISGLSKLVNLEELRFSNHRVKDISVVKIFKNLTNLEAQNNLIENFEGMLFLNNLKEAWIRGNTRELNNEIQNFKDAKLLFEKINKKTLTNEDIKSIDELLKSKSNVKNFFAVNTLIKLEEIKEKLAKGNSVENDLFDENYIPRIDGELEGIETISQISVLENENILEKLPKSIKVTVKLDKKDVKPTPDVPETPKPDVPEIPKPDTPENPKPETPKDDSKLGVKGNTLTLRFVDEKGKDVTDELKVVANADYSSIDGKFENGFYIFKSDGEDSVYDLTVSSKKYSLKDRVTFTTTYDRVLGGRFVEYNKNSERIKITADNEGTFDKKLFVVSVENKDAVTPAPQPQPKPINPDVDKLNGKIGIEGNRLALRFVVDNNEELTEVLDLTAYNEFDQMKAIHKDGIYYFENSGTTYTFTLELNSKKYVLGDKVSFSTDYYKGTGKYVEYIKNDKIINLETTDTSKLDKNLFVIKLKKKGEGEIVAASLRMAGDFSTLAENSQNQEIKNIEVPVKWNLDNFKMTVGEHTITGDLVLPDGLRNTKNLKLSVKVVVNEDKKVEILDGFNKIFENIKSSVKEFTSEDENVKIHAKSTNAHSFNIKKLESKKDVDLYEIQPIDQDGNVLSEKGEYTITFIKTKNLPVENVFYLNENGEKEFLQYQESDGKVTFKVNHFSKYGIKYLNNTNIVEEVQEVATETTNTEKTQKTESQVKVLPKTNVASVFTENILIMGISALGLVFVKKKRR